MKNKFGQYYKKKPIKPALRQAVYERDNFTCQYCGFHASEKELEIDHIVPVSRGGTNDIDNLRTSCSKCNKKKGAKLERSKQAPDTNKLEILAEALDTGDRVPTADKLKELADALETTSDYLLDNGDVPVSMLKVSQAEPPAEERSVVEKSRGKLLYIFKDGEKLELPDTDKGYELFKEILMRKAVMA